MSSHVLTGAHINVYINNKLYRTVQGISFDIDYGETEIYGIDSMFAQEITGTKISVKGKINGIRVKNTGGIQGDDMRPYYWEAAASPYISIRIADRQSGEDILFIPQAKVTRESMAIGAKQTVKYNIDFVGIIPLSPIDRAIGSD